MIRMTSTRNRATRVGDIAEALFASSGDVAPEFVPVLTHPSGADRLARREALRPVYEAIVARIGAPTLLGGAVGGPSVRWCTTERVLLLSGDHTHAKLSVHPATEFERTEWQTFDDANPGVDGQPHGFDVLPYTWQLDRKGPGSAPAQTYNGMMVAGSWDHAVTAVELMLAAWVEQYPVQAPGDWIGFNLWNARDWGRDMIVSYTPADHGRELAVGIHDRGVEQTGEHQARIHARGWRTLDEHQWWRTELPETDPDAPRLIAALTIAECRARGATTPAELMAHDISAGDDGDLWLTGLGLPTHPARGEHY